MTKRDARPTVRDPIVEELRRTGETLAEYHQRRLQEVNTPAGTPAEREFARQLAEHSAREGW